MADHISPTKGNLIKIKNSLALARTGYELLDRKRNILVRETMLLMDKANSLQDRIVSTYMRAYRALMLANISLGIVDDIAEAAPLDDSIKIKSRSVMGVVLPRVSIDNKPVKNTFGFHRTDVSLDEACARFNDVKRLAAELAEIESSVYRLSEAIRKTQKRANALKNIVIPRFESQIKFITEVLDEREREEFSRLKVIKKSR